MMKNDGNESSGDLIKADVLPPARPMEEQTTVSLPPPSRSNWLNRRYKRAIESARKYVLATNEYMDVLITHRKTTAQLEDIKTELNMEAELREGSFQEAYAKRLEQQKKALELEGDVDNLKRRKESGATGGNKRRIRRGKRKTPAQRLLDIEEEWKKEQQILIKAGVQPNSDLWERAKNIYDAKKQRLLLE